ncbi:MAG TPA: bifunctional UDP-3-O-[3-hydroxymyristoyl] N-acetylglucosamine deacetylase/3-hydroxyacyl-ACP dehydratase [Verrucomicrobiae bacterium]|nr:bifunctional UDP-3-O-[3-hydroxymyristoyl] N-acetylglucosamine deacetylase/3-hydroxyacyl-ACP dehydratase [Verrucomicrobiae bacterium]
MSNQQTLRQHVSYSGIGLHSGNRVNMTFLPAPGNSGIRFRRIDLDGKPEIEARIENVSETTRSTTLAKGNIKVQTVEHVLSAFAGLGIDNAIIELDSNEPPIADGSAREYCRMIQTAGLDALPEKREIVPIKVPIEVQQGETSLAIFPHETLKISCTSADKDGRFTQYFSLDVSPESWEKELAAARTFCFYEEIEFLIKSGLIRGGSLENAVVIREDAVLTNEPLRYGEEFVRHKILDIIGDLSLVGKPVAGHVVAIKPSHAANCELAREIFAQMRRPAVPKTFALPPIEESSAKGVAGNGRSASAMETEEIMRLLPHRYPFLMVDRVIKIEGNKISALKNVSMNELYFQGHFPGHPIMPGVLQLEGIAQVAGILMLQQAENHGKLAYFMSAESVKWRNPVRPGDTLVIDVELTKARGKIGKAKGVCSVNGTVVSEAEVTFMLMES